MVEIYLLDDYNYGHYTYLTGRWYVEPNRKDLWLEVIKPTAKNNIFSKIIPSLRGVYFVNERNIREIYGEFCLDA